MTKRLVYVLQLALLFASALVLMAQADHTNAFTGTWKLNVEKSKFSGPVPQSSTVTIAPDGTFTFEAVDQKGEPHKWSHAWSVGKEVPIDGIENGTIISKLQGRTADDVMKVGGKTVQKVHAVLSPDGKTITATIDGTDPQGRSVHDVEVYEKQ
jgi:hypothetical protein